MNHVFGPVYSRRLSKSLGIDLVPFKTCTQDCVYCQLGPTTCKLLERASFYNVGEVISELRLKLETVSPNFITIAGSGEPTLCKELGTVISEIKKITPIPLAVLTNGSLLYQSDVRKDLIQADIVCPSLDAGDDYTFQKVNRPIPTIDFETFLNGLIQFRSEYSGKIWLEVLLVRGITDTQEEVIKIAQCSTQINPDRIHLNTVTRPPADASITGLTPSELDKFASLFTPTAEVIAEYPTVAEVISSLKNIQQEDILNVIQRHPCSLPELSFALDASEEMIKPVLKDLIQQGKVEVFNIRGRELFRYRNK
ncbi:MAG: radical SAM protein [Candidatus Hydrogenedens sp.]